VFSNDDWSVSILLKLASTGQIKRSGISKQAPSTNGMCHLSNVSLSNAPYGNFTVFLLHVCWLLLFQ
jgi:hypothetical protein